MRKKWKDLPPCALAILDMLDEGRGQKISEVVDRLEELGKPFAPRTVSDALRRLLKERLCWRGPNFEDMRNPLYYALPRRRRLSK